MAEAENHYGENDIAFLEAMWGDGYLSPGGPEEVARILDALDLTGATVLDIGCGAAGVTLALARDYGAARVVGIDVEPLMCATARARVDAAGLQDRVEIRQVAPGPLPIEDASVDVAFSKDSIIHIPDKEALCRDVFRVLRPGGWFAASDWMIAHDDAPSPAMAAYIAQEDLGFGMASPRRYADALAAAGFRDVRLANRNAWYREQAAGELARLTGPERERFVAAVGEAEVTRQITTWRAMLPVVESGEHCPHHFRARKP